MAEPKKKGDRSQLPLYHPLATPIVIRGIHYPSMTIASQDLGVPISAISSALNRGTIDFVGLGRNYANTFRVEFNGEVTSVKKFCEKQDIYYPTWMPKIRKAFQIGKREINTPAGKLKLIGKISIHGE